MHSISRKLFLYQIVLLAGCHSATPAIAASGSSTVSLAYMARLYTMKTSRSGTRIRMENKWNSLEFETNGRRVWINGIMVWLHHPCRGSGNNWSIREEDFKKGVDPILRAYSYVPKKTPKVVVLDPGHGGKDTGAIGPNKVYEKNVVLDIAHRVRKHLESRKITVRMTRTGDTFPSLPDRSDYATKVSADLFISIHADGAGDASACGVETFITAVAGGDSSNHYGEGADTFPVLNNKFDSANAVLGFSLQSNHVKASGRSDRGLRRARFSVIKNAPCPAALVECGFLTNPSEESLLNSASFREKVAGGITNGVLGYFTLVQRAR
ncbi:MAG: N-acetylmuramoyl-L-alanine amidase [Pontiellaceae bacterium]|nr:N-acetylmuramoyl-L-alanine amidase [Pontiellaceae bacterium]MBN2783487.1 N-acetylmuramoyl-L-alanine amidase [Pontiellaceae bacterium]